MSGLEEFIWQNLENGPTIAAAVAGVWVLLKKLSANIEKLDKHVELLSFTVHDTGEKVKKIDRDVNNGLRTAVGELKDNVAYMRGKFDEHAARERNKP